MKGEKMLVDKFIKFLKKLAKENEICLGEEYRKEFFFTKDSIGFYLTSIPKNELENFLKDIVKGEIK